MRWKFIASLMGICVGLLGGRPARATVSLNAIRTGGYSSDGFQQSPDYTTGVPNAFGPEWRGFVVFDLTQVPSGCTIQGATLSLANPYSQNDVGPGDPLTLHVVAFSPIDPSNIGPAGVYSWVNQSNFNFLGGSTVISTRNLLPADSGQTLLFPLSSGAVADLQSNLGDDFYGFGMRIAKAEAQEPKPLQFAFGGTVAGATVQLQIDCLAQPTATPTSTSPSLTGTPIPSETPTDTPAQVVSPTLTQPPTGTAAPTPSATFAPTPIPAPCSCVGDCNGDGVVTVNELIVLVDIALGNIPISACPAGDADQDGNITINEIVAAVNNALNGCPACPTPTATVSAPPTHSPTTPATATSTSTATRTVTATSVLTATFTATLRPSNTPSGTPTPSFTQTPAATASASLSLPTPTPTGTSTATRTPSNTPSSTLTPTHTRTPTRSSTPTGTVTRTPTRTFTPTRTSIVPPPHTAAPIRGRFGSVGPIRTCGGSVQWNSPDGPLIGLAFNLCGDDLAALAATIVGALDQVAARGSRAMLAIGQGTLLPASWLARCSTFFIDSGRFQGNTCLPWDANYQADLRSALVDAIGPAVRGHPALVGVYMTMPTMTNGFEMHFRVDRGTFPYPGDQAFRDAYRQVMDIYQQAFDVPVVFEAGHCLWAGPEFDCQTPLELYRYTRDRYGVASTGISLWNCAERFWAGTGAGGETFGAKGLIEEASADGASIGCQTVGSFTNGACRFSDPDVGDYGTNDDTPGDVCPSSPQFNPEQACEDTMRWAAGVEAQAILTARVRGTWAENWSADFRPTGVYNTSPRCRAAIDLFAGPPR